MSRTVYYRQCRLERTMFGPGAMATFNMVSFIPEKFAVLNKKLKLRDDEGKWTDGYMVIHVGWHRVAEEDLPDYHRMMKEHRKRTGDSLRKSVKEDKG